MNLTKYILGEYENFSLEYTYIISISFFVSIAFFSAMFINLLAPVPLYLSTLASIFTFLGSFFVYCRTRCYSNFKYSVELLFFTALIFINIAWFFSGGIYGPNILLFITAVIFLTIISSGIKQYVFILLLLLNSIINYTLEYMYPHLVYYYYSRQALFFDNLLTFIIIAVLIWITLTHIMKNYDKERFLLTLSTAKLKEQTEELEKANKELKKALKQVKQLKGFIPICANCKKIRDDKGFWNEVEIYIHNHSEVIFSHSLCPECKNELSHTPEPANKNV